MGLGTLGGCYLAYDLLGGKRGPLRTIARVTGYVALCFIGYVLVVGLRYAIVAAISVMLLWSCPVLAYGPKHGQKHGAERKRIPKIEDSLAERGEFELSVPICEQSDEAPCVVELNQNQSRPLSTDCFAERPVHHPCATSG
jgi:hypothetical protein